MAWLNATPKPPPGSKREKSQESVPSRIELMKSQKRPVKMPPNPAPEIVRRLTEIGLTEAVGMGYGPISWQTIDAWQRLTCVRLPPWEVRLIRHLSEAYVAESRRAESENCPAPWQSEITEQDRKAEMASIKATLGLAS